MPRKRGDVVVPLERPRKRSVTVSPSIPVPPFPASAREAANLFAKRTNGKKGAAGTVVRADQQLPLPPRVTTGSLAFDLALGGGWPTNNWTEVVGQESAGKTSVVLKSIARNQKINPDFTVLWVAAEPFDDILAEACEVDRAGIFLIETNIMEEAYQHIVDGVFERAANMYVLDSYPALIATQEDEKDMEGNTMGGAKVTNQFIRKVTKAGKRSLSDPTDRPFTGIFINQWREKIGVIHGDPRTTPGGKGKNYWAYGRVDIRRDEWIVNPAKEKVGQVIKLVVMKMKGARPQRIGVADFYFADHEDFTTGDYDTFKQVVNLALLFDLIGRRGSGYVDLNGVFYRSQALLMDALREDDEQRVRVEREVLAFGRRGMAPVEIGDDDEDEVEIPEDEAPSARPRKRRKTV